jgi:hypothetical protein
MVCFVVHQLQCMGAAITFGTSTAHQIQQHCSVCLCCGSLVQLLQLPQERVHLSQRGIGQLQDMSLLCQKQMLVQMHCHCGELGQPTYEPPWTQLVALHARLKC